MIDRLREAVNSNDGLVWRGRWVNLDFLLGISKEDFIITVAEGRITKIEARRLPTHTGRFAIRAARETWEEHWQLLPRRNYHDIWSMLPKGLATLDGDLLPLMQNLQYFKDVIASPRAKEDR